LPDGRRNNGGHPNSGRKPKAQEQALVEKLTPYDDLALQKLIENVEKGQRWAIKLFMEYRYGKPKETQDITVFTEQPIFEIPT